MSRSTTDSARRRRAAFLQTIRDEDIMGSLRSTADDDLIHLGLSLAVEAYEGRWAVTVSIASSFYRIPADVLELLAAAALAHLTPATGAVILARPNEASMTELRAALRPAGMTLTYADPQHADDVALTSVRPRRRVGEDGARHRYTSGGAVCSRRELDRAARSTAA